MEEGLSAKVARPASRRHTGGWSTSPYILGAQALSTVGYAGVSTNLILYLTRVLQEGNAAAANNVSNWIGTSYLTSLVGGFLADAYWGRYYTTAVFLVINLLGMVLVTLAATVPALSPSSSAQVGIFYLGLYTVALGYGGYQPCLTSLGADQFDKLDKKEQSRFFNWYYLSITLGVTISGILLVYVEDNLGWGLGFGISMAASAASVASFLAGTRRYRCQKTAGNPITRVAQVLVAAAHNKSSPLLYEVDSKDSAIYGSRKIQHTSSFSFLDRAAAISESEPEPESGVRDPWRLCTVTQVEEVKCMIRMLPVWATSIVFSSIYTQVGTLFIVQGAAMDTRVRGFKIPPASLYTICTLSVLLLTPAYEWILVPLARKLTGNKRGLTTLQRMGVGLLVATLAAVCAAVVELFRLKGGGSKMSALWQIPQYSLVGASEVFTYIGQLDFFYEQSPDGIRGLGVALAPTSYALGNYCSSLIVTLVMQVTKKPGWIPPGNLNSGHLDYFFWLLAALSLGNLVLYCACAAWYRCIQYDSNVELV